MSTRLQSAILLTLAYLGWGFAPLYWSAISHLPTILVISLRVVLSVLTIVIASFFISSVSAKISAAAYSHLRLLFLSSVFLVGNWSFYIWGIANGYVFECGTGYFICPLLFVAYGVACGAQRLSLVTGIALFVAFAGVLSAIISYGSVPWLAFGLAGTFFMYGLLHRHISISGLESLYIESLLMLPVAALVALCVPGEVGEASVGANALVALVGVVTLFPLVLFTQAVRSASMFTVGMLQNINPVCQIALGLWYFKEEIPPETVWTAAFSATALVIYLCGSLWEGVRKRSISMADVVAN